MERSVFLRLLALYGVAHGGLLLLPDALFWMDWMLHDVDPALILERWAQYGAVFAQTPHVHIAVQALGPWSQKVLTFALMFACGVLLWHILQRQQWLPRDTHFAIVALFLVLPLYSARVALIHFPSTVNYFLFFLGWYCLDRRRVAALVCFFLSFCTYPLLLFYALPLVESYLRSGVARPRAAWGWVTRNVDLLALPWIFWTIKVVYYGTYGEYAGTQEFTAPGLLTSPAVMASDLLRLEINPLLAVGTFALVLVLLRPVAAPASRAPRVVLVAGLAALACALLPYWIAGRVPTFYDWTSRHQLLMPLGTALLVVWATTQAPQGFRSAAWMLALAASLAIDLQVYGEFFRDWSKQRELIALIAKDERIRAASLVVFDDRTPNARRRRYSLYEWTGLMKRAYGNESRFGMSPRDLEPYAAGELRRYMGNASLNTRDYTDTPAAPAVIVTIDGGNDALHSWVRRIASGRPSYRFSVSPPMTRSELLRMAGYSASPGADK